jgi:hypothetical protein
VSGENYIMRSFIIVNLIRHYSANLNNKTDRWGRWHVVGRRDINTGFWWVYLKERDYLEELGLNGTLILQQIFKKWNGVCEMY